jgi:hypothetical protein
MITSLGMQNVIDREFVPEGKTVNRKFRCQVLESLLKRISIVQPQFRGHCLFCTTVPIPLCITRLKCFLAKCGVMENNHPPHSPDFYQLEFYIALSENCSGRKTISGCQRHQEECNRQVNCGFSGLYWWLFQLLLKRSKKCVAVKTNSFGRKKSFFIRVIYLFVETESRKIIAWPRPAFFKLFSSGDHFY